MGFGGIDVKSSRVGRGAAAVAVVAVAALGMSGCAAFGGVGGGAVAEGAERPENALPPGVLPPNDPPQPGDARLGPDGHYDYSAPDFVLKNPCDTDAYQVALQKGWQPPAIGSQNFDSDQDRMCGIVKESDGIGISHHAFERAKLIQLDPALEVHSDSGISWYTAEWPNHIGSTCFAGVDAPGGAEGVTVPIGGFSNYKTRESACRFASEQFIKLFGGDIDV